LDTSIALASTAFKKKSSSKKRAAVVVEEEEDSDHEMAPAAVEVN
jgi:hypothetical protein